MSEFDCEVYQNRESINVIVIILVGCVCKANPVQEMELQNDPTSHKLIVLFLQIRSN
jgi:hypothetical protein